MTLIRHEWRRAVRTRRIWIVLAFFLFSAILDPLAAKFLPQIIEVVGKLEVGGLPQQNAADALKSFVSDSSRLAMLAFVLSFMGTATDEFRRNSGSGAFVFTRRARARQLIGAKIVVGFAVGWGCFLAGYAVATLVSWGLFRSMPWRALVISLPLTACFWAAVVVLLMGSGAAFRSSGLAVAVTYGSVFLLSIFELIGVLAAWSPTVLGAAVGPLSSGSGIGYFWKAALVAGLVAGTMLIWGVIASSRAER